jgi:hypothetical protein
MILSRGGGGLLCLSLYVTEQDENAIDINTTITVGFNMFLKKLSFILYDLYTVIIKSCHY